MTRRPTRSIRLKSLAVLVASVLLIGGMTWTPDSGGTGSRPVILEGRAVSGDTLPVSVILYPEILSEVMTQGPELHVTATRAESSPPTPPAPPVIGFRYKLLRLDTLEPPVSIINAQPSLLYTYGDSIWSYQEADTLTVTLPVVSLGAYLFGVRAVDADSTEEELLQPGRNTFKFMASSNAGLPQISVSEPSTGRFEYPAGGSTQRAQVPGDIPLHFTWSATAEAYGGTVDGYSWGVDLVDPGDDGPGSGWSSWSSSTSTPAPVSFPGGESHAFYLRARDTVGGISMAVLELDVVLMSFDRDVLLVDDAFDDTYPRDSENDTFWQNLISTYAVSSGMSPSDFFLFEVFGANDRGNLMPAAPTLEELGRYKLVIWDCRGTGYNAQTGLLEVTAKTPRLASYLASGGKLWLEGRATVAATTLEANRVGADLTYPKETLGPGDFAWDFLKLHSTKIINDKGNKSQNLLNRVTTAPGFPVFYDTMIVDLSKVNLSLRSGGGFSYGDAIQNPIFAEAENDFIGDIDSLYVYGSAGVWYQGLSSSFEGKLCGLRWHDPDPGPLHGRIQWFGFPMYYWAESQAQQVFNMSLDWFREDEIPVPVVLLSFSAVRREEAVILHWEPVSGELDLSFEVYRSTLGGDRIRLSPGELCCQPRYEFVDASVPATPADYWLTARDRGGRVQWFGPISVGSRVSIPITSLAPVVPNPARGEARIAYSLAERSQVQVSVLDLAGRRVALLVDGVEDPGPHLVTWNPATPGYPGMAAGFYVVRLEAAGTTQVRKLLVLH